MQRELFYKIVQNYFTNYSKIPYLYFFLGLQDDHEKYQEAYLLHRQDVHEHILEVFSRR